MIKNPIAVVSALYKHPARFDINSFEISLARVLAGAYAKSGKTGFVKFAEKVGDAELINALVNTLSRAKLTAELRKADEAWSSKPDHSEEQMRDRLLALSLGKVRPEPNLKARAKELLPELRACKTLDAARNINAQKQASDLLSIALALMPDKSLRSFGRRFDKFRADLDTMPTQALIAHVCDLVAGKTDPSPKPVKPLKSAAMKAKWSGKEPD